MYVYTRTYTGRHNTLNSQHPELHSNTDALSSQTRSRHQILNPATPTALSLLAMGGVGWCEPDALICT